MYRLRTLVLLPLYLAACVANAQQGGDLQAQIIYAFHAEDANQLTNLVQTLATEERAGGADSALRYHLAHAQYRLGLLYAERHSSAAAAAAAFKGCIEQLNLLLQGAADSAESLALSSACYVNLAQLKGLEAMLLRARAADRMGAALKLAPRNPRVLFLSATQGLARFNSGSAEHTRALAQLQLAAELFEQSSATRDDAPGWGHADAYLELGRQLESRGDFLGARDWIEKSLIAAPDFKAAQRQLATLVSR